MRGALGTHDVIVRDAIDSHGGVVLSEMGDGMAGAFASPTEAIEAAVAAQVGLGMGVWWETGPLLARMGLHAGDGELRCDGQDVTQPLDAVCPVDGDRPRRPGGRVPQRAWTARRMPRWISWATSA